jgi:REP element-mobilizing transposase RayT
METHPEFPWPKRRNSLRKSTVDYRMSAGYFITICAHRKESIFGYIRDGIMYPNELGRVVEEHWFAIPEHFPFVVLDEFVVMPNHLHGILILDHADAIGENEREGIMGTGRACPARTLPAGIIGAAGAPPPPALRKFGGSNADSLSGIIGSYKSSAARVINQIRKTPGAEVWHRNFFDRIIENSTQHDRIRTYIQENPKRWAAYDGYKL